MNLGLMKKGVWNIRGLCSKEKLLQEELKKKIKVYTECNRKNGPDFGRVFLRPNYTDMTQNTYIQS